MGIGVHFKCEFVCCGPKRHHNDSINGMIRITVVRHGNTLVRGTCPASAEVARLQRR